MGLHYMAHMRLPEQRDAMNKKALQEKLKGKHLLLQPHLDDVPFSVGSMILNEYIHKEDCTIYTIFGKEFFNIRNYEYDEHAMQLLREEEAKWFQAAGMVNKRFELEEAGYRGITSIRKLFRAKLASEFDMQYEQLDYGNWQEVSACIKEILKNNVCDYVWIPAGVGGHCDHIAVRQAVLALLYEFKGKEILFFEELPYSLYSKSIDWKKCVIKDFHQEELLVHDLSDEEQKRKYESLQYFHSQIDARQAMSLCNHAETIHMWMRNKMEE